MYRVFFTHKKLGRFCIRTFHGNCDLKGVINLVKMDLIKPTRHTTSCEILDDNDNIVWTYQPTRNTTKKENKMTEKQFSNYLVTLLLQSGFDCCSVCNNRPKNKLCDNCDTLDNKVCYKGIREYAEKKEKENGDK